MGSSFLSMGLGVLGFGCRGSVVEFGRRSGVIEF